MRQYPVPFALWTASVLGLITMLLGEGIGDAVGLVLVALPIGGMLTAARPRRAS